MNQKKVLIIDDEKSLVETIRTRLEQVGFSVRVLYEGLGALEVIREMLPDVILLDIGLPGRDGNLLPFRRELPSDQPRQLCLVLCQHPWRRPEIPSPGGNKAAQRIRPP